MVIPRHWRPARNGPRILTLVATPISTTQINLSWSIAAGNVGLAGFKIYVNGALFQTLAPNPNVTSFPVTGLSSSTQYTFAVAPYDTNGIEYAAVPVITQTTQVPGVGAGATSTTSAATGAAGGGGAAVGASALASSTAPTATAGGGNQPPVFTSTPAPTFFIGVPATYALPVIDPDGDAMTSAFAPTSAAAPAGVTMDGANNRLAWSGSGSVGITSGIIARTTSGLSIADADWLARSTAPGVVAAYGMDTLAESEGNYTNSPVNGKRGFFDTVTKIGSGGSMRFDIGANELGGSGGDISGKWTIGSAPWGMKQGFGQGSTFYLQYRHRLTPTMNSNLNFWDSNWKSLIVHHGNSTCVSLGFVHTHPEPDIIYTNCGGRHMRTSPTTPDYFEDTPPYTLNQDWNITAGGPPWTHEPGGVFSLYPTIGWFPSTNAWYTVYIKCHVGTLQNAPGPGGIKDSTIEMWVQEEGATAWKKLIACRIALEYDIGPSDVINNFQFGPYMTGLTVSAPSPASMWVDQVIVSTQPIALPSTVLV